MLLFFNKWKRNQQKPLIGSEMDVTDLVLTSCAHETLEKAGILV